MKIFVTWMPISHFITLVSVNETSKVESERFYFLDELKLSWIVEPAGASGLVVAGYGLVGEEIFICRAKHFANGHQHHIPGYKSDSDPCCMISFGSEHVCEYNYKVLQYV